MAQNGDQRVEVNRSPLNPRMYGWTDRHCTPINFYILVLTSLSFDIVVLTQDVPESVLEVVSSCSFTLRLVVMDADVTVEVHVCIIIILKLHLSVRPSIRVCVTGLC